MNLIPQAPIEWVRKHLGEIEIPGLLKNNPFIVSLFKDANYDTDNDETAWCAALVCTALQENGFKDSNSPAAASYIEYGEPCELMPGCIVVIEHDDGGHHVTFCNSVVDDKYFEGLGGNQSNQIKISTYERRQIVATRCPVPLT